MLTPNWRPDDRTLRQFAIVSPIGFAAIGLLFWRAGASSGLVAALCGAGIVVGVIGFARPPLVRPVYLTLLTLSAPIGWVVSGLLLRLVFYGVVTPLGLVFRWSGRDALLLERPTGDTYWRDHEQPKTLDGYFRQS